HGRPARKRLRRLSACGAIRGVGAPGAPRLFFKEGQHMSTKVSSMPTSQPTPTVKVPHEKIAMRAFEKWCKNGRQHGRHVQDWLEAERELAAEYAKASTTRR